MNLREVLEKHPTLADATVYPNNGEVDDESHELSILLTSKALVGDLLAARETITQAQVDEWRADIAARRSRSVPEGS